MQKLSQTLQSIPHFLPQLNISKWVYIICMYEYIFKFSFVTWLTMWSRLYIHTYGRTNGKNWSAERTVTERNVVLWIIWKVAYELAAFAEAFFDRHNFYLTEDFGIPSVTETNEIFSTELPCRSGFLIISRWILFNYKESATWQSGWKQIVVFLATTLEIHFPLWFKLLKT